MSNNKAFEKFMGKQPKGAAKKEALRQEKRKAKAAMKAIGDEIRKKKFNKDRDITEESVVPFNKKQHSSSTSFHHKKNKNTAKGATKNTATAFTKTQQSNMPLNKYIAYCGICGRREAAALIKEGIVTVNGKTITEPGFKVLGNEDVKLKGKRIFIQKQLVYILLNKPKDYITTAKDPEGRKTVYELIKGATTERVYPVGRLDRNTTGVLLLTNDGELTQKLTHPSYQVKKIYEVKLDKPVTKKDIDTIAAGIVLEDGFIQPDSIAYVDAKDKSIIGIEIHSGKNRIVRRIFEHMGYDVKNLDRVLFANLSKKNVERGKWRMLTEKEVRMLKFLNKSFIKKPVATENEA